jgi:hypothetical protein
VAYVRTVKTSSGATAVQIVWVLYDVSTLYFETDQGDGFREPGFSKERRLEPQITIRLLTGQDGLPLASCHAGGLWPSSEGPSDLFRRGWPSQLALWGFNSVL